MVIVACVASSAEAGDEYADCMAYVPEQHYAVKTECKNDAMVRVDQTEPTARKKFGEETVLSFEVNCMNEYEYGRFLKTLQVEKSTDV